MSAFLHTLAGLAAVLAVIGAAAWLARRLRERLLAGGPAPLALRGALAVGPRERIVLVDVEGVRLVLGVAPGRVAALHVFAPAPAPAPEAAPQADALVARWTS